VNESEKRQQIYVQNEKCCLHTGANFICTLCTFAASVWKFATLNVGGQKGARLDGFCWPEVVGPRGRVLRGERSGKVGQEPPKCCKITAQKNSISSA